MGPQLALRRIFTPWLMACAAVILVSPLHAEEYDVVILDGRVIDPETIRDVGTYQQPNQPAVGVQTLLVSGELVVDAGELLLEAAPGQPIRRVVKRGRE